MSAQPSSGTELTLSGDAALPRDLYLRLNTLGYLSAHVRIRGKRARSIAFAHIKVSECHLARYGGKYSLHAGNTIFDVTPKEAGEIHATFAPLGLQSSFTVSP